MTTAPEVLRDRRGCRPDLSLQFHIDHAKRLAGFDGAGQRVNPEELRRAREILRLVNRRVA